MTQKFFNQSPYFDLSANEIANNYVQILFEPGRALQSRELIGIQSLQQYQTNQIGDFLFKDGSPVVGGHITFNNSVLSLTVQANDNITLSDFVGELIINPTGPVVKYASVIAVDTSIASNTVAGALIVKYLSGQQFVDGDLVQIATGSEQTAQLVAANSTSKASIASINDGVFYSGGYFLQVTPQTIVLDSLNPSPNCYIGLEIDTAVVTYTTDSSLLDPAQGNFNFQAPGADRYQYKLNLSQRSFSSTDLSQFISLVTVQNGVITNQIDYPELGNIEQSLAQRTYDTNGNFVVNPWLVTTTVDLTTNANLALSVAPGSGFVDGFEFITQSKATLSLPKAQTTNNSVDYSLSLDFGNFFVVSNVGIGKNTTNGNVTTNTFSTFDLHWCLSSQINVATQASYSNTKIGTTKFRDLEFYSTGGKYESHVLDTNVAPILVNANALSSNTQTVNLPFSTPGNFKNVPFTIIAGNSNGDSGVITTFSGGVGQLAANTTQLLDTNSQLLLSFGIKDINSVVATPNAFGSNVYWTQQGASNTNFTSMDIDGFSGKDVPQGNTILFDSQFNRLIFPLPQAYIAQNNFSSVTFVNRKTLQGVAFTSGNSTIGTGTGLDSNEQYNMGFSNAFIPDQIADTNFIVIIRNAQTSGYANGQFIIWNRGSIGPTGNGIFQTDATHCTIATSTSGNFVADVIFNVEDLNASVNFRRSKTLIGNTANTTLRSTDSYLNGAAVIGAPNSSVYIDTANALVWFTSNPDIQKVPNIPMSMYLPDVINIIKIYDSGNPVFQPNTTNAIDITGNYTFDSGQNDNYYDHASLYLKPGFNPPTGQTVVMLQGYNHDATAGFFNADSYSALAYGNNYISTFYSKSLSEQVSLRDSIDFRPTRTIGTTANVQSFIVNGLRLPYPYIAMVMSYAYYLPRMDKLVLTADRQFALVQGIPAVTPILPPDQANSMTLYTISLDPFTFGVLNANLTYVENKRYTMSDIGTLDQRISKLETTVVLNAIQAQSVNTSVLYQTGTVAKEQYGILTDTFDDFSIADDSNPDLLCFITGGVLMPYQIKTPVQMIYSSNTNYQAVGSIRDGGRPLNVSIGDGPNQTTFSLSFQETPLLVQNTSSNTVEVQPFGFGEFNGSIFLNPSTDYTYSQNIVPQVVGPQITVPYVVNPYLNGRLPIVPAITLGTLGAIGTNPAFLGPLTTTGLAGIPVLPVAGLQSVVFGGGLYHYAVAESVPLYYNYALGLAYNPIAVSADGYYGYESLTLANYYSTYLNRFYY